MCLPFFPNMEVTLTKNIHSYNNSFCLWIGNSIYLYRHKMTRA